MTLQDLQLTLLLGIEKYFQVRMQLTNNHVNKCNGKRSRENSDACLLCFAHLK